MSEKDITDRVSANLARIRKEFRYTQKEVADLANLNMNYYAKIERGESMPSLKTVKKISKALKVTATDIVGF